MIEQYAEENLVHCSVAEFLTAGGGQTCCIMAPTIQRGRLLLDSRRRCTHYLRCSKEEFSIADEKGDEDFPAALGAKNEAPSIGTRFAEELKHGEN